MSPILSLDSGKAPEIGIALAKEISDDPGGTVSHLQSFYGFTSGYEGHHEFGYFWQRWFKFKKTHYLNSKDQSKVDINALKKQLYLMESVWQRPLIFKNAAALPLQTEFLGKNIANSLFVHIQRDLVDVAASLLEGRKKYLKDTNEWFSIKPKEYEFLKYQTVYDQIAGQVHYTNEEILKQLESIPKNRKLYITYNNFCKKTELEMHKIKQLFDENKLNVKERNIELPKLSIRTVTGIGEDSTLRNILNRFKDRPK